MKVVRILFVLVAIAAAAFSLSLADAWYPVLTAAVLFIMAYAFPQGSDDSRILILAAGELLVIAVAAASFPAGFIVQCAVIGAVIFEGERVPETRDGVLFALWCITALAGAVILDISNQVLLPFLAMTGGIAAVTALMVGVHQMRERRMYAGGN